MKLFLFGGSESQTAQVATMMGQIKQVLLDLNPNSVLNIPFARYNPVDIDWPVGWFRKMMEGTGIEVLDASVSGDIKKAKESVIYINGGVGKLELLDAINSNVELKNLVLNAKYIRVL